MVDAPKPKNQLNVALFKLVQKKKLKSEGKKPVGISMLRGINTDNQID